LLSSLTDPEELSASQKYLLFCRRDLLEMSESVAIAQAGVLEESGPNRGSTISLYLASVGLGPGQPYCAAGQYWCFYQSCRALHLPFGTIPIMRTGSANRMFDHAASFGRLAAFSPQRHDLVVWRKPNSRQGHVERIISVGRKGWVKTIAFNTSSPGSGTKAQGVFIKRRNLYHFLGRMFVRGLIGFQSE
jgi:hypothetical protein